MAWGMRKAKSIGGCLTVVLALACCSICFAARGTNTAAPERPAVEQQRSSGTRLASTPYAPPIAPRPAATTLPFEPTVDVSGCTLGAVFEADVTIPDGSRIPVLERFTKTWRIRNAGTCDWGRGYALTFVDGDQMGGPDSVDVPPALPGESTEVSVLLVAPAGAGASRGYWQICVNTTECFGDRVYVDIVAYDPSAATRQPPTAPPSAPVLVRCGAVCHDGWVSSATGRGACSHHGGVHHWLYCDR